MNDEELDQLLNRWKSPAPPSWLRARVLAGAPRRERFRLGRPLRWAGALAAALCMLAIGAQNGGAALDSLGDGISRLHSNTIDWIADLWVGHIALAFRQSNPKIYVDGELRSDVEFGGSGVGAWVNIPGDGKYVVGLRRTAFEGTVPPRAGRFDGHALEFRAGERNVRIESTGTYGFHERLPVYVLGPVAP